MHLVRCATGSTRYRRHLAGGAGVCARAHRAQAGRGHYLARCAFESVQGRIEVFWRCENGRFDLECTVPEGVMADVALPDGTTLEVAGGTHRFGCAA